MTSPDFNQTQLHKHLAQNELSLEEIMTINKDLKTEPSTSRKISSTKQCRPRTTSQSRLDQQLENIAKMLDESTAQEELERMKRKSPIVSSVFNGKFVLFLFLAPLAVGQRAYVMARCPSCIRPSVRASVCPSVR